MNPGGLNEAGVAAAMLQADDVRTLPESDLLAATIDISREIERLEALRVAAVSEIDERAVSFDTLGFRSVKLWLAASTLLEVPAAARILALGRALRREPEIADTFHDGRISAEHAALITRFCERPPRGMPADALDSCRNVLLDCATGPAATTMTVRTCITRLERIFESDELPPSEDADRNEFQAARRPSRPVRRHRRRVDASHGTALHCIRSPTRVRLPPHTRRHRRRHPPEPRTHHPHRVQETTPSPHRPGPRLRLPRLRRTARPLRRPPYSSLGGRRSDGPRQPGAPCAGTTIDYCTTRTGTSRSAPTGTHGSHRHRQWTRTRNPYLHTTVPDHARPEQRCSRHPDRKVPATTGAWGDCEIPTGR